MLTKDSFSVIGQLLKRDLLILRHEYVKKYLETCFLLFTNAIVFAYFMPEMGLGKSYGPFLVIGAIAIFGLFEVIGKVSEMLLDLEGEQTITYNLTMPITSEGLFCYIGIKWALTSSLIAVLLFPAGKLFLFTRLDLGEFSYLRLIPMFITAHLFYGFFSLWLAGILRGINNLGSLFLRVINPIFMFGAYFYSWHSLYDYSPMISWITLINPVVYVMEGMRAATLGQSGYIPFWICLIALWIFIFACASHAIHKLKKRLDCV